MSNLDVKVVLLAAGYSSRMKQCKFLMPFSQNETLIEHILKTFEEANFRDIVIVTQPAFAVRIEKAIKKFPSCSIQIVINENPEMERFHSIKLALTQSAPTFFYFIHNCDMPFFDEDALSAIFENRLVADVVAPSVYSKGTHPILINRTVAKYLSKLESQSNLSSELKQFTKKYVEIDNEKALCDINTIEEYQRLISYQTQNTESSTYTDECNAIAALNIESR